MRTTYNVYPLLVIWLLVSCSDAPVDEPQALPPLFPQPKSVIATPKRGYSVNQVSGDTVQPVVNSLGDTVSTGVWTTASVRTIHADEIERPRVFTAPRRFTTTNRSVTRKTIDLQLRENRLDTMDLQVTRVGGGDGTAYVINERGDTVVTGLPLPIHFRTIRARHSEPVRVAPSLTKETARTNLRNMDVAQGLNSPYVLSVLEDRSRNIWLGYWGGGLSVFNGTSLKHFSQKHGLLSNQIMSMVQDKRGNIWAASWGGGIMMYDGVHFNHYDEKQGALSNHVWSVMEDSRGDIWFASIRGVTRYDGKSFFHLTRREGLSEDRVSAIVEDRLGRLWICNSGGTIDILDGTTITHLPIARTTGAQTLYDAIVDQRGRIWIGTDQGAFCIHDTSIQHLSVLDGLSDDHVTSLFEDKSGKLWFGTSSGGVNVFDGRNISRYTEKEGLTNVQVRTIREDSEGNILIGTDGAGLFILDGKSVTHYSDKDGLSDLSVTSICKDSRGNYWFGTEEGGINMYDGRSFQHLMTKDGLSSDRVWPVLEDHHGNIWFGTWHGGAYKFDGEKVTNYTEKSGLSSYTVLTIYEDSKNDLLFGTFGGGITIYDGSSFRHITEKEGLSNSHVISILEDSRGHYWFGTVGGGVTEYNGKQFRHFTEKEGLGSNTIRFIHEDHFGNIWFGTDGAGISIYDGTRFTYLTDGEGLSDNYVKSIVRDHAQHLWVSGSKGLTRIAMSVDSSAASGYMFTSQVFREQDGLKGIDFYLQSAFLDNDNRSWWGSDKGLVTIDHDQLQLSSKPPSLAFKQIDINGHFVDYHNLDDVKYPDLRYSSAHAFENYPVDLVLPHNSNHLTFHFAAIDWAAPHKVFYTYRMLGLGDSWSDPASEPKADYRNIPFGEYTFQVCAIGESGRWSDPVSYTFTIRPPWWRTWWAYSGYAVVALLLLRLFSMWREQKLRAEKRVLERTVGERTAELSREKSKSDDLLLNILPGDVADELKSKGHAEARYFDEITVLFTDFRDFTSVAESMSPSELVRELHTCFEAFDTIIEKYGIEKIKTIGDAYMAAGGLSATGEDSVRNTVLAALEMQDYIRQRGIQQDALGKPSFEMRVGIHTGPVVAGIVGVKKFQYDIWGDTVNTAARMESAGAVGKVNISQSTYLRVKDLFKCTHRGMVQAKNKGELEMYYVESMNSVLTPS